MRRLSKSKLLAWRQCPKRLWLEIHRPELREDSDAAQARFQAGFTVGEAAQRLYDPCGDGVVIDAQRDGFEAALAQSIALMQSRQPIFEAGFVAEGAIAFADIMLPIQQGGTLAWRMVEVKSSTSVKDYHRDDTAIQAFIARAAGVPLTAIALAHIDSEWVYPGNGDYAGLLTENDLTSEAFARQDEVREWVTDAQKIAAAKCEPELKTGAHCSTPFECGFHAYCSSLEPKAEYPVSWLPRIQSAALKEHITENNVIDMRDVPNDLLNDKQRRVKECTLSGRAHFDLKASKKALKEYSLPARFMDFETIQFAIPIWKGTRPYEMIPFQFSIHHLTATGELKLNSFIDLSGDDPSFNFSSSLVVACGNSGPIYVYNAAFERSRIRELAERFFTLKDELLAINERIVDLLPIAKAHFYHPEQQGSWSIKYLLPSICPELRYDTLDGVQHGGMAMDAYLEAVCPDTTPQRKAQIEGQLLAYCSLDTLALVELWKLFTGRKKVIL